MLDHGLADESEYSGAVRVTAFGKLIFQFFIDLRTHPGGKYIDTVVLHMAHYLADLSCGFSGAVDYLGIAGPFLAMNIYLCMSPGQ